MIVAGLSAAFPAIGYAAKAGGGTTTTATLTYVNGVQKWVMRIDPFNVQGFQLDVAFDPARCQLDQSVGVNGIVYKNPFTQTTSSDFSRLSQGLLQDVAGSTPSTSPGDVDIFELVFIDLQPGAPITNVPFTVFASSNDSITGFDPVTSQTVIFDSTQIAPTTRTVTPGVSPHIWDPDTQYNNGTTGGSGTWNTSLSSWDDLPLAAPFNDTAWNNATHAHDIAVFGGNPGTGIVTVTEPISVGGFQFDISGYNIQGNVITLSAPAGATPTIDTGANNATIGSSLAGSSGVTKLGSGTLTLTGSNTYTGATTVIGGTLTLDFSASGAPSTNILNSSSTLTLNGGVFNVTGASGGTNSQSLGGVTVNAGSSAITTAQNGATNLSLALGEIVRNVGGTVDFALPTSGSISTTGTNTNGILGGYATVNGNTWATVDAGGNIASLGAASYSSSLSTANVNLDVTNGGGTLTADPNSIRFNDAHANTVIVSGTHAVVSGGILVTGNVGNNLSAINGGTLQGASGQDLVVIQNNTSNGLTLGSSIANNGTATGLTKSGPGILALTGNNTYTGATNVVAGTLLVGSSIANSTSTFVGTGATLGGSGAVSPISGGGVISPGTNGAGILTGPTLNGSAGTQFKFDFGQLQPTYANAPASGNDVLRLTSATPFTMRLGGANVITINFLGAAPSLGQSYRGGFFTDSSTDFSSLLTGADFNGTLNGSALPNGLSLRFDGLMTETADFSSGAVTGRVMQITVVPEPSVLAMLMLGAGLLNYVWRFRGRNA